MSCLSEPTLRVLPSKGLKGRRLLSTDTPEDCLRCAVWDDVRESIDASLDTMHAQYAALSVRLAQPVTSSSEMQIASDHLSRQTHAYGWQYMSMSDNLPYRLGQQLHDFTFGTSTLNVIRLLRDCPMAEVMNTSSATPDEIDEGIVAGVAAGMLLFAVTIRPLLQSSPGPSMVVAWVFFVYGMYYTMSIAFLWVAYEIPVTCSIPYPVIPFNMADDLTHSVTRWIPACMCAYFPLLTLDTTPCDASCSDRDYSYSGCGEVVDDYGLIWSIEFAVNYFLTGLLKLREPDAELTPMDRTEHSCWVFFSLFNAPLILITAGAIVALFASCFVLMAIIVASSVQAHLHLLRAASGQPRADRARGTLDASRANGSVSAR